MKYFNIVLINLFLSISMANFPKPETVSKIVFVTSISDPGFEESIKDLCKELDLKFNNSNFQSEWEKALASEEHIEVENDNIWSYTISNGEIQMYSLKLLERENCISYLYPEGRDGEYLRDIPLDKRFKVELTHYKKDTLTILGFNCHKVLVELNNIDKNPESGMEVKMEMYVTEKISIPGNIILNLSNDCIEFFPLAIHKEIKTRDRTLIATTIVKSIE
jgi:hypothetical protein